MAKLKLILPIVLVVALAGGGAYWFLLKPKPAATKAPAPHVKGELFALSPEFLVNLTDGHYGKVSVALLLKEKPSAKDLDPMATEGVKLLQDPIIRATITDDLTGISTASLIQRSERAHLREEILKDLERATDVEVKDVLFTDVVVQ
jgi:flagellar FliL protein